MTTPKNRFVLCPLPAPGWINLAAPQQIEQVRLLSACTSFYDLVACHGARGDEGSSNRSSQRAMVSLKSLLSCLINSGGFFGGDTMYPLSVV